MTTTTTTTEETTTTSTTTITTTTTTEETTTTLTTTEETTTTTTTVHKNAANVEISRKNTLGDELAGAVITLTGIDENGGTISFNADIKLGKDAELISENGTELKWVSGTTPTFINGLADGTYTLHEVTAPKGYEVASDVTFVVKNGEISGKTAIDGSTITMMDNPKTSSGSDNSSTNSSSGTSSGGSGSSGRNSSSSGGSSSGSSNSSGSSSSSEVNYKSDAPATGVGGAGKAMSLLIFSFVTAIAAGTMIKKEDDK